jgi:7-keto-8-aminopelargonate synthetase-like enzyme
VTSIGGVGAVTTTTHAVITFDGTSTATIVYTTSLSATATTCKVDLTGKSPPVCS